LYHCGFSPAAAPALARLLGGGALTMLECQNMDLLDAPAAAALAAALRANATLTSLMLNNAGVFNDPVAAAELLGALTGHGSFHTLRVAGNRMTAVTEAAAGAALGALVAANTPALTLLDVSWCSLGDDGLRALFQALPANTHLRTLYCSKNDISDAFAASVLLPAVRANASLRMLRSHGEFERRRAATLDADALVAHRGDGGQEAAA
jgi:hypothetical protein